MDVRCVSKFQRQRYSQNIYRSLVQSIGYKRIHTFQDDKRLEKGTLVPFELHKAIEMSQVSVIIFSHNYASSEWSLDELVKIMECKNRYEQIVIPIFYNVDPSVVRNQTENFAEAFDKQESKYNGGMEKVQKWRNAPTLVANLKGWDVRNR
ncbi:TMV resistance protein N-like isoform X2 [Lycium barbarum]|uniref:TMV resistance protein N-like isoform X2 n=1 Tax=Lycium barbarum TaxID=112863 RepID=UPI00293E5BA1|nr:TMV resistance protein N-like isoform X2 [Lycium barbarum]